MSAMRCAELVGAENLIHPPDLGVPDFLVHATMWEIESNSVGNALRQAAVPPVQAGSVGTPPGGVDRTVRVASTRLKPTGAFGRPRVVGGAWRPPRSARFPSSRGPSGEFRQP